VPWCTHEPIGADAGAGGMSGGRRHISFVMRP
jgi:hypothetical protein